MKVSLNLSRRSGLPQHLSLALSLGFCAYNAGWPASATTTDLGGESRGDVGGKQRELQDQRVAAAREWLQSDHENLYVLMTALHPQMRLMSKVIDITGSKSEVHRLHTAAASGERRFRIEEFYNGSRPGRWLHSFQSELWAMLSSREVWSLCVQDENSASNIARLCLRASAVAYELIQWRRDSFPCKLFKIIDSEAAAQQAFDVFTSSPCLLDEFSWRHISAFPSVAALRSQESIQILAAVAVHFQGSIYSTESLHSRNSRRAKHRLTHDLALRHLGMWHQVRAQPPWMCQDAPHVKNSQGTWRGLSEIAPFTLSSALRFCVSCWLQANAPESLRSVLDQSPVIGGAPTQQALPKNAMLISLLHPLPIPSSDQFLLVHSGRPVE